MKLSPIQEKIVETPGNLIVRAGTGKTHTMVNKIAKEIDDNHTHKVIAAITFTIKAAQEIKDRLSVDVVQHFIGTNNSFVIEEVIKPFMKDVYGADFDLDMSTDYSAKVDTFQEAIEKIRNEGILCSYRDNKRKSSRSEKVDCNTSGVYQWEPCHSRVQGLGGRADGKNSKKDQHDTCQGADTVLVRYCHGTGDSI